MSWPPSARRRPPSAVVRRLARAGARPALFQALAIVLALTLSGVLTHIFSDRLEAASLREQVRGEMSSIDEEFASHGGPAHLPHTLAKRTRLWRGFSYRLVGADGRVLAGMLPDIGASEGWSHLSGQAASPDLQRRPYLILTHRLPNGSRVSVGQDLSAEALRSDAALRAALLSGAAGVLFGVSMTYLISQRAWRRVASIAEVARRFRGGAEDPRAPVPPYAPRDDLDELALTFNAMLDRISALVGQVRQVSRDLAHDMRTPLSRVRLRLERVRAELSVREPAFAERIETIENDLTEALRTFDALLQLAEIEASPASTELTTFDLGKMAAEVAEAFRLDVEEGGRCLDVVSRQSLITGHERLLRQALANMIENAARHTPTGARIAVQVDADPTPRLVVQDDGPGIAAEHTLAVLRPMVRLEASRHLPGSGLGLSIVAAIAARHSATLELADAAPGLRATLTFQSAT
jgi:signal transduction histidine kinase